MIIKNKIGKEKKMEYNYKTRGVCSTNIKFTNSQILTL